MADGEIDLGIIPVLTTGFDPAVLRAMESGGQHQSGAEQQQKHISHGGVDPAYITNMEAFEGLSHDDIYNGVQQMQPGVMQQFGDQWVAMSVEISGAVAGLTLQTLRASADMDGAMAEAGAAAGRRFLTEVADVHEVISTVGHRVKAAAFGAEVVRKTVPAPASPALIDVGDTPLPPNLAILADAAAPGTTNSSEEQKEQLRLQAVAAMNSGYKPTFQPAGENVPTFVAPTVPGEGGSGAGTSAGGTGAGSGTGGGGTGAGGAGGSGQGTGEQEGTQNPQEQQAGTGDDRTSAAATESGGQSSNPSTSSPSTGNPASTNPAATTPASTTPAAAATAPGTGTAGTGAGRGSGTGTGAGSPAAGSPAPGRSMAGAPVAAVGAAQAAGGAGGAANRAMMPGMMAPPGARGKSDDDDEHQAPDYLRGVQPELIGDELPTVPQALGADSPAATTEPGSDR